MAYSVCLAPMNSFVRWTRERNAYPAEGVSFRSRCVEDRGYPAKAHVVAFGFVEELICECPLAQEDHESRGDGLAAASCAQGVQAGVAHPSDRRDGPTQKRLGQPWTARHRGAHRQPRRFASGFCCVRTRDQYTQTTYDKLPVKRVRVSGTLVGTCGSWGRSGEAASQ